MVKLSCYRKPIMIFSHWMVCSMAVVFPRDNPFSGMHRSSAKFPVLPWARKWRRVLFLFTRSMISQTWNLSKTFTLQKCVIHLQQFSFFLLHQISMAWAVIGKFLIIIGLISISNSFRRNLPEWQIPYLCLDKNLHLIYHPNIGLVGYLIFF